MVAAGVSFFVTSVEFHKSDFTSLEALF